jgi:polyisoprenoid-binding protein YceI
MNPLRTHTARRHNFSLLSGLAVLLAVGIPALAQTTTPIDINLDPAATSIHWTLNTTVHTVHGSFKLKNGSFHIDPLTGEASGQIVIDAASGESADSARDNRMQSIVLESPKYPTITFRPTHVVGKVDLSAPGPVTVEGFLNLHGQDHPMQITVNLHPQAASVGLAVHFAVPYVAWGLKDPSTFIFRTDKQVILDVDATAIPVGASHATDSVARPILRPSETHLVR